MHVYFLNILGDLVKRSATNKMHDFTVSTDTGFFFFFCAGIKTTLVACDPHVVQCCAM